MTRTVKPDEEEAESDGMSWDEDGEEAEMRRSRSVSLNELGFGLERFQLGHRLAHRTSSFILRCMGCSKRTNECLPEPSQLSSPSDQVDHRPFKFPRLTMVNSNHPISLNRSESRLCHLLDRCTKELKNSKRDDGQDVKGSVDSLELRIAGGWVRDKLLGVESNDLDIAISSLTGQEFANAFSLFVLNHQETNREHDDPNDVNPESTQLIGKIATIEARPDQSKHLETATTTFLGLDLDFVQLRSEEYGDQESRIPSTIRFGTPLEDALRRDITINSLFYNVHTREIEDHTGKGLIDLQSGMIRTPLPAEQTFKDDPLRLLRCIRFSTRFGFQLDSDIIHAAKSEPIRLALKEKISKERVGIEVDKMLKGPDPLGSLKMIHDLGLYLLVFTPPANMGNHPIKPSIAIGAAAWLNQVTNPIDQQEVPVHLHPHLLDPSSRSLAVQRRLFLACALLPYRSLKAKLGKREVWAGEVVLMESLKLGNHDKNFVSHLLQAPELLNTTNLKLILSGPSVRLDLGRLLRNPHIHDIKQLDAEASLTWEMSFLFSLVVELNDLKPDSDGRKNAAQVVDTFNQVVKKLLELDLALVVTPQFEKRRLDGKEICQVLRIKPGKQVAQIIERLTDRQIEFPNQSKEEASDWLKDQVKSGQITV